MINKIILLVSTCPGLSDFLEVVHYTETTVIQ